MKTLTGVRAGPLTLTVRARVNRRAGRIIVRVDPADGAVLVTMPSARALPEALAFIDRQADWIGRELEKCRDGGPFREGMTVPYRGVEYRIIREGGLRAPVRVEHAPVRLVRVGGDREHLDRRLACWLKGRALSVLRERAGHYSARLGRRHGRIRVRDMSGRWGSCTSGGAMSFSWRLIMAPPEILDYVVAHECTHLVHMDHSPAFRELQATLGVDRVSAGRWLRENGQRLFSYGARR